MHQGDYVFGKARCLPEARAFGRHKCSQALKVLYSTSRDDDAPSQMEQMATIHWLNMFKIAASTEARHIMTYCSGMTMIVAAFGPHTFAESRNLTFFEHVQWSITFALS